MSDPEVVLEEVSPHSNLEAVVEQDDRVAHFYVRAIDSESFGIKCCWVRNLRKAPIQLAADEMRQGIPPMLPRPFCAHPEGAIPLEPDRLRLVWFPEGDGVALMEDGEMLAAIPPWSGFDGFAGYARDCLGESPLCWKLDDPAHFNARINAADLYWRQWGDETSPWPRYRDALLASYEAVLGPHSRYFTIDGGDWPPRALVEFDLPDCTYLLTIGVSLRPQPAVEMHCKEPEEFRRIELAACLSNKVSDETPLRLASYLSGQSTLPWSQITFLAHGHTIPCDVFADTNGLSSLASVLLVDRPSSAPSLDPPRIDGERVSLLWAVPIYPAEQQMAEREGSHAVLNRLGNGWPLHIIGPRDPLTT